MYSFGESFLASRNGVYNWKLQQLKVLSIYLHWLKLLNWHFLPVICLYCFHNFFLNKVNPKWEMRVSTTFCLSFFPQRFLAIPWHHLPSSITFLSLHRLLCPCSPHLQDLFYWHTTLTFMCVSSTVCLSFFQPSSNPGMVFCAHETKIAILNSLFTIQFCISENSILKLVHN